MLVEEVYDALKEAGASEEKSRAAARAIASWETRLHEIRDEFAGIRKEFAAMKWMLGFNLALSVAILFRLLTT